MKYLKKWDILFDGDCDKFQPGDTVHGKLLVDVEKSISVTKIKVRFKGKAEVTMFIGDYDTQKMNYFNHEKILFKCPENTEGVTMEPGHYEFPFSFNLPLALPYTFSCEGDECGAVAYLVRATIYRPNKYTFVYDKPFTVVGVLDLNCLQDSKTEISNRKIKTMSCLLWTLGDISATLKLPKKGYVPGEEIPIYATVSNSSTRRIKKSAVLLVQRITMTVYGSNSVRSNKICHCQHGIIPPGQEDMWHGEPLLIPEGLPPTSMRGCELIDIQYLLQLVITPAGLSRKIRVPVDIILGTVPLRSTSTGSLRRSTSMKQRRSTISSMFDDGTCV